MAHECILNYRTKRLWQDEWGQEGSPPPRAPGRKRCREGGRPQSRLHAEGTGWQGNPVPAVATLRAGGRTFRLDRGALEASFPQLQRYRCRELAARPGPPAAGGRRAALRRTWARARALGGFALQPLFLLARREERAFADILMWDFAESQHNLSLKERCFLRWLHERCPCADFVFKGDDNLFVNVKALTEYLNQTPNASSFIHGNIQHHSAVMRHGKYAVSHAVYPMGQYPDFASGGGFIMPQPALAPLYNASLWLPVFPLDDVYLGFLTLAAGLAHRHDERFRVWGLRRDELQAYREALTVHGVSPERMEQVWKEL
ncbi:acetylgalactosaminyl-O-glycosyl-glycoprotein beta-1,3-N-acetylglucosaminyltransferase-like [Varanus komodoensis]|uniref:acetylgalactosaminyl-O-glycosyl-glycoprotein beta-1,3-N-acetylglucosaminyltransferase-like n=1 Tax=Varanus komodoensis TaxID=61221 RepID=UPI001CF7C9A5|nr:acetylgalactosaminyl-O-glycosyl-glycoprotein beta-1,3-N-acetylglucosaminyltransferase-like [Varanus komodoensis]